MEKIDRYLFLHTYGDLHPAFCSIVPLFQYCQEVCFSIWKRKSPSYIWQIHWHKGGIRIPSNIQIINCLTHLCIQIFSFEKLKIIRWIYRSYYFWLFSLFLWSILKYRCFTSTILSTTTSNSRIHYSPQYSSASQGWK